MIFLNKLVQLPFLRTLARTSNAKLSNESVEFSPSDDLDLGLYYLRTLSSTLNHAPDAFWGVLATQRVEESEYGLVEISKFI
jgi:hypothetical protein